MNWFKKLHTSRRSWNTREISLATQFIPVLNGKVSEVSHSSGFHGTNQTLPGNREWHGGRGEVNSCPSHGVPRIPHLVQNIAPALSYIWTLWAWTPSQVPLGLVGGNLRTQPWVVRNFIHLAIPREPWTEKGKFYLIKGPGEKEGLKETPLQIHSCAQACL